MAQGMMLRLTPQLRPPSCSPVENLYNRETGLYYYRARYYDPGIGRFLQQDPHPGKTSMPVTVVNRYAYATNGPTYLTDPDGKFIFTALAISFVVGAGISGDPARGNLGERVDMGLLATAATGLTDAGSGIAIGIAGSMGYASLGATITAGAIGGGIGGAIIPAAFGGTPEQILLGALAGAISGGWLAVRSSTLRPPQRQNTDIKCH